MEKGNLESFISAAIKKHGDRYCYKDAVYASSKDKLIINCLEHGPFLQSPNNHLKGANCPKCAGRLKFSKEWFLYKAEEIHGGRYDYSQADINERLKPVKIICPVHGEFFQTPKNHLKGCECPKCSYDKRSMVRVIPIDEFVRRSNLIHNFKYKYGGVLIKNTSTKVAIECPVHGVFYQTPDSHLQGRGCRKCGRDIVSRLMLLTKDEFVRRASKTHGNKYSYENVEYKGAVEKVSITCPIHGDFLQYPNSHVYGHGCKNCSSSGVFDKEKPAILYYLQINHDDELFYKIGITNRTVEGRFRPSDMKKIEVIRTWNFNLGSDAYSTEQMILRECKGELAGRVDILASGGNTEIFSQDIFS